MDGGGAMAERFEGGSGRLRTAKVAVVVTADGARVEHPLLVRGCFLPISSIASVVHLAEIEVDDVVYRREPRVLHLSGTTDANLAIVLRSGVEVGPFKRGAENGLPITAKERKHGVTVDLVALRVDDPVGAAAALARLGAATGTSILAAMASTFGVVVGEEAIVARGHRRQARRRARRLLVLAGLGAVVVGSLQLHAGDPTSDLVRHTVTQMAVALAIVAVVGVVASARPLPAQVRRRPVRDVPSTWRSLAMALLPLVALLALVGAGMALRSLGVSPFVAFAPAIAAPAAAVVWFAVRAERAERAASELSAPDGPLGGS